MNRRTVILAVTMALTAFVAPRPARAAEGELDAGFGSGGVVLTPVGGSEDIGNAVALDAQGGILVAGQVKIGSQVEFGLVRYLQNGSVDAGFGFHGAATTVIGPSSNDDATGVAVDPAGRIVLAGRSLNATHYQFGVARFTATGQPDLSFNGSGIEATPIGPGSALGAAVAVDPQGRIIVAGSSANGPNIVFTLARYLPTGGLDPSFGSGGIVNTPLVGNDTAQALALDSQGRIVVAGRANEAGTDDFLLARYLPGGTLDPSFGAGAGYVRTPLSGGDDGATGVALDPQGRIVAGGATTTTTDEFALVRYLPDGTLDPSFNGSGIEATPIGTSADGTAVAVDAQGRPVLAGFATVGGKRNFALARYQANGALDPSFGGGVVTAIVGAGSGGGANALAIDPQGRLLAAGWGALGGSSEFALARFIGDQTPPAVTIDSGPADGGFTNDPTPTFGFGSPEATTRFSCGVDGAAASCSSPLTTARLADGRRVFAVTGTDPAGNASAPATRTFTVDTKAARLKIKGRRTFMTHRRRGRAKFKITASEPVTLKCRLDRGKPKRCKRRDKTPKLKPGRHRLRVTATDRAGNVSHAAKKFRVIRAAG